MHLLCMQGQGFSEKALVLQDECHCTRPALISTRPFSDQFKQTERVSKQRFLPSDFGRLIELMPVYLSGTSYDFICLKDLSTAQNTVGPHTVKSK